MKFGNATRFTHLSKLGRFLPFQCLFMQSPLFFSVLILLSPPSSVLLISPLHQLQRNSLVFLGPLALFQATLFLSSCRFLTG